MIVKFDDGGRAYTGISIKELRELEIPQSPALLDSDTEHGFLFDLEDTQGLTPPPPHLTSGKNPPT